MNYYLTDNAFTDKDGRDVFFWKKILDKLAQKGEKRPEKFLAFMDRNFETEYRRECQDPSKLAETLDFRYELTQFFEMTYDVTPSSKVTEKIEAWKKFRKMTQESNKLRRIRDIEKRVYPSIAARCSKAGALCDDLLKLVFTRQKKLIEMFKTTDKAFKQFIFRDVLYFYNEKQIKSAYKKTSVSDKSRFYYSSYESYTGKLMEIFTVALYTYKSEKSQLMTWVEFLIKTRSASYIEEEIDFSNKNQPISNFEKPKDKSDEDDLMDITAVEITQARKEGHILRDREWAEKAVNKLKEELLLRQKNAKTQRKRKEYENYSNFIREYLLDYSEDEKVRENAIAAKIGLSDRHIRNMKLALGESFDVMPAAWTSALYSRDPDIEAIGPRTPKSTLLAMEIDRLFDTCCDDLD